MALWGPEAQQRGAGSRRTGSGSSSSSSGRLLAFGTTAAVCLAAVAQGFVMPGAAPGGRLGLASRAGGGGGGPSLIPRRAGLLSQLDFKPAVDLYAKFPEKHQASPQHQAAEAELTLLNPGGVRLSVTGAEPNGELHLSACLPACLSVGRSADFRFLRWLSSSARATGCRSGSFGSDTMQAWTRSSW